MKTNIQAEIIEIQLNIEKLEKLAARLSGGYSKMELIDIAQDLRESLARLHAELKGE